MKMQMDHGDQRIAVLFPGQGVQARGIGKEVLQAYPQGLTMLAELSQSVDRNLIDLLRVDKVLTDPVEVHIAMVSFGLVAWRYMSEYHDLQPVVMAGHSLGEITALACAGALSPQDAMQLAKVRGQLFASACRQTSGGMLTLVGAPIVDMQTTVMDWIHQSHAQDTVWLANVNSPNQLVVSGQVETLSELDAAMQATGISTVMLPTAGAFHTPLMKSAAEGLFDFSKSLQFSSLNVPVISSMTGKMLTANEDFAVHLALQVVQPVRWLDVLQCLQRSQVTDLVEAGPGEGVFGRMVASCQNWSARHQSVGHLLESGPNAAS